MVQCWFWPMDIWFTQCILTTELLSDIQNVKISPKIPDIWLLLKKNQMIWQFWTNLPFWPQLRLTESAHIFLEYQFHEESWRSKYSKKTWSSMRNWFMYWCNLSTRHTPILTQTALPFMLSPGPTRHLKFHCPLKIVVKYISIIIKA